jgi:hypothetical protein
VRRVVLLAGWIAAAAIWLVPARPAGAHFCAFPVAIETGRPQTVTVAVAAEEDAHLVDVVITMPDGFRLDDTLDTGAWTSTNDGATVRYTGGVIAPLECEFFSLVGVAERPATLLFPLTVTDDAGTVHEYTTTEIGQEYAAQLVHARPGSDAGATPTPTSTSGSGPTATTVAAAIAAVLAVAVIGTLTARRVLAGRRTRPDL